MSEASQSAAAATARSSVLDVCAEVTTSFTGRMSAVMISAWPTLASYKSIRWTSIQWVSADLTRAPPSTGR